MNAHHSKAIIISPYWAGIIASLITSGFLGSFVFVFNANAQIAVTNNKIATLQQDLADIKDTKIEPRLASIETKVDWLVNQQRRDRYGQPQH